MASSVDSGKLRSSICGLHSGNNQYVNNSGLEEVPVHGAELMNEFMNLLNLNGMNYTKAMTKFAFLCPYVFASVNYELEIDITTKRRMLEEVDENLSSDFARVAMDEPFSAKFVAFFEEVFAENSECEAEGKDEKQKASPGHVARDPITQKKDGTFVIHPVPGSADTLTEKEIAVRTKVEEHNNGVVILLSKFFEKLRRLATLADEDKYVIWLPDEPPPGGAGEAYFGVVNMSRHVLLDTVKMYNNGKTNETRLCM
jgi:hypothetical protein